MREILFRGKRIDNGEWVEGNLITGRWYLNEQEIVAIVPLDNAFYPHCEISEWHEVDPATVGQYTGMRDCRGNRIFEGDIVVYDNSPYNAYCEPIAGEIAWRNGSLCFKYKVWKSASYRSLCSDDFFAAKCEVIGNIHDNPELLREEDDT